MDYRLCYSDDVDDLNQQVNILLSEGWELYGTPFFARPHDFSETQDEPLRAFCQALIKD